MGDPARPGGCFRRRATLLKLVPPKGLTARPQLVARSVQMRRRCPRSWIVRRMTKMEADVRAPAGRLGHQALLYCADEVEGRRLAAVTAAGAARKTWRHSKLLRPDQEIRRRRELDDTFGTTNAYTLRWFYLYLGKEYARHLGHADLLRERIDGVTGE